MSPEITFDESGREFVLDAFDKAVDDDGYIIEADDGTRVLTYDGKPLKEEELGLIAEGSDIFVEDNFASIVDFVTQRTRD